VVEARGRDLLHLGHGVVRAGAEGPLESRLQAIFEALTQVISAYRPDAVAVEGLFTFRNARSALVLGHARGVALLVAAQSRLPVFEYAPARVKKAVGAGGADGKDAVARMVRLSLRVPLVGRADASDALAVAICHVHHQRMPALPARGARRGHAMDALGDRLAPAYRRFGALP